MKYQLQIIKKYLPPILYKKHDNSCVKEIKEILKNKIVLCPIWIRNNF